ncbi:MAG TPA: tetratricopeptide repeat protein [Gemmatimonadales bacterium]|nr:tetratricopeptide repeat protein [Gemmatimonadales bacterium]
MVCRVPSICLLAALLSLPAFAQGLKPSEDIPQLESAVQHDSNDAQLRYRLAIAYWSRERFDDAKRSLLSAVSIEPRFAAAYLALGYLPYARRHQLMEEEAKRQVPPEWRDSLVEADRLRRRAFLINPLVDLQILGAVISVQPSFLGTERNGRVVIALDPFSAFVRGDYGLAYSIFSDWISERTEKGPPDSIPSRLLWFRGLAAGHVGQYDTAIRDFQLLLDRGLRAERSDSVSRIPLMTNDFRYVLAMFEYRSRRFDEAISLYKDALANDMGLFMAHVQMGKIYEERKMWPDAIQHFQDALGTNPDDPSLYLDLGVIFREAGRLAESESTLTHAMEANPRDSRVPFHLGLTLQQEGKRTEARSAFLRFVSLAPSRYAVQITDAKQRLVALQ